MKNTTVILLMLLASVRIEKYKAQGSNSVALTPVSPGGYFDKVFDKDGREYSLSNLQVRLDDSQNTIQVSSTTTCSAGFFNVYFANGSGMESTTIQAHNDRRALVCHILENVSGLLGGWATWPSSVHVNMLVDDISNYGVSTPSVSGVLGLATSFYAIPNSPASSNPGLAENMLQKTIKSKQDAWTNLTSPVISTGGFSYYHGAMAFNFANPNYNWFTSYSLSLAASNQLDLYTVILHEITHALGFGSLISATGISKFGVNNNYYSYYDKYLYDKNNAPLLTSSGCSSQYGLSFTSNTLYLAPGCTSVSPTNSTTCSNACLYNSGNLTWMPVYTPACFEPPSSLSHFEDMCFPTPNTLNNDQYFTMSNANGNGTNKRYLKAEERKVFCDLGYTVSTTYTSAAVGASTVYSGACIPPNIWGQNDGFANGAYTYTSTGGSININISSGSNYILFNDANTAVTASCVQTVYNNGTVSTNTPGVISFSPNAGYVGPVLLRYIPVDAFNNQGNITYIYAFVFPGNCVPASPCDLVQNGTFESKIGCGPTATTGYTVSTSCWIPYILSPDLFVSGGCTSGTMTANLGVSTYSSTYNGSSLPFPNYNGSSNTSVIGLESVAGTQDISLSESYANFLGASLVNNQVYTLSFWAYEFVGAKIDPSSATPTSTQAINTASVPMVITFAGSNQYAPPGFGNTFPKPSLNTLKSVTLASVFNTWKNYNVTFTYTPSFSTNWLYMGMDQNLGFGPLAVSSASGNTNGYIFYVLLDNISIKPLNQSAQFSLPPNPICASQGYTNLAQYVNIAGGTFSGTAVTPSSTPTGVQYNFNTPGPTSNGLYTITYTYTDNLNCVQSAVQQVSLGTVNTGVALTYITATNCVNGSTVSVVSPTAGLSYSWSPGAINNTNTAIVSPTATTIYTAQANLGASCAYVGTIQIVPTIPSFSISASGTICPGQTAMLNAIGSYSNIIWTPGSYTSNPYPVSPTVTTIYTGYATSSLGCLTSQSFTVNVPNYTVAAFSNTTSVCGGASATLTAMGQNTSFTPNVTWSPGLLYNSPVVVTPTTTTTYTALIINQAFCNITKTVVVNVTTFSISPSSANICAGSLGTLTAIGNFTSIVWQPGGYTINPLVVTATANSTYTATASFTNGCVVTQTFAFGNVVDNNPPGYQINTIYPVTCAGNSETLSVSSSSIGVGSYTWLPSGPTNTPIVVTPTSSSTYSALVTNNINGCVYLAVRTVTLSNACCSGSLSAMTNVGAITQTVSGSKYVNGNIIVPIGGSLTLAGEFLFAGNVKITVSPGSYLNLKDAHLYACSNNMWQGIEVLDGGSLNSVRVTKDNLIEDAITAVNAVNQATTNLSNVLTISNTTFNKNYIDISISNYQRSSATYPFSISSCVFTCRNLPFNSTSWPQTGTVVSTPSNNADLRYIVPGTLSGLSGPYLTHGFTVTPLKNPYSSQYAQTAIQLIDVGVSSLNNNPNFLTVGDGTTTVNFNVFDAHNKFISATNSNVRSYNNVFQNTQVVSGTPGIGIQAINTYTNANCTNSQLDLIAPYSTSVNINRFYNCHTGINAVNIATLTAQYAEFKSTQATTVTASPLNPGQYGMSITGNRFSYYYINNCNFINLTTGIYAANTTGLINPTTSGQVWGSFVVSNNTFAPTTNTVGFNFMRDGVIVENILSSKGMPGGVLSANVLTLSPLNGLRIQYNNFNLVYRGVRVSNFANSVIAKITANNTITLKQDHLTNTQWGVNHSNNYNSVVNSNTVTGFNSSTTYTVSGSYSSMNSNSSSLCNILATLPVDMEFAGSNSTMWRRNNMSSSSRGVQLSSNGIMGVQGSFAAPSDNVWTGTTWIGTKYHTFVISTPNTAFSTIYTRSINTYTPTNNAGNPALGQGSLILANNLASYTACIPPIKPGKGGDPVKINLAKAIASGTLSYPGFFPTETNEINQILLYRELEEDSLLLSSDATLQSFFSSNQSGNFGALSNINELLNSGNLTAANTALGSFSETSPIQGNYKLYYQLYKIYLDPAVDFNATDLTNLLALASKCPFVDGPIVYNARSLYTCVTGILGDYNDEICDQNENALVATGGELGKTTSTKNLIKTTSETYQLFPNPATDKLHIRGTEENEELIIEIKDVGNKLLFRSFVKLSQFTTEIKLDLINGVYFVSLINPNNERVTKKLVISK